MIPESQAVSTEIILYTAQDPDQMPYGIVSYEIKSGKLLFKIFFFFFYNVEWQIMQVDFIPTLNKK